MVSRTVRLSILIILWLILYAGAFSVLWGGVSLYWDAEPSRFIKETFPGGEAFWITGKVVSASPFDNTVFEGDKMWFSFSFQANVDRLKVSELVRSIDINVTILDPSLSVQATGQFAFAENASFPISYANLFYREFKIPREGITAYPPGDWTVGVTLRVGAIYGGVASTSILYFRVVRDYIHAIQSAFTGLQSMLVLVASVVGSILTAVTKARQWVTARISSGKN